jgi:hypothetical protein
MVEQRKVIDRTDAESTVTSIVWKPESDRHEVGQWSLPTQSLGQ